MPQEKKKVAQGEQKSNFVFGKLNYQLMLLSIAIVIIGFILMAGKTDIYSFTKITLAPIVVVAGFALGIVAILKNPTK
ncbi:MULTISPECIES: DUF3098 domain-containing protein [Olivibacter]|jgi:hypothetical protein|uniref:DUF3098 domain-containing protein n=3 Tax=Sphingobacteriaceae TaxID=84566 RepID=F4C7Z3_SPHS2|nr:MULTISPECIES: DUF3098 domain-containing protein [Olivibacter]MCL4637961.1 DUF3098 domain-containing protein [Olivibacter sp. UJ_SKK_5.1]MDM8174365.1 DUF3098 domain-containing protein [Olivibacter sp. 47]MDX3916830.1 DUF3098 domain-containing protein [Pseudosphingobacterium sp.]QEL04179.1 DUF3098 domain-containing protein [Olivibacter sp. LS-1]